MTEPATNDERRLPPWMGRLILAGVATFFGVLALLFVLERLRDLFVWLVVALFLSFALEPAVNWLASHGWRRGLATAAVLFALSVVGSLIIGAMVPLLIDQIGGLVTKAPGWLDRISIYTDRWFGLEVSTERVLSQLHHLRGSLSSYAGNIAGNVLGIGAAVIGAVFQLLTIALFTFYLVADGPKLRRTVCGVLPPKAQKEVLWAWEIAIEKTGGYLYSRALLALVSGFFTLVVLSILHVPFALALALWVGVLSQFVPVVGTYIAMIVPVLVAALSRPISALVVVVYFLIYQQVENYLLSPRITARTMQLHPAVAFGSVIAGGSMLGPVGAFLALPAAAIIQAGLSTYLTRHDVMETALTQKAEPPAGDHASPSRLRRLLRRS